MSKFSQIETTEKNIKRAKERGDTMEVARLEKRLDAIKATIKKDK